MKNESSLTKAEKLLRAGELVVIPTETVYGLGADATNDSAIEKIYSLKGRPSNNPLICHVANFDSVLSCVNPLCTAQYEPLLLKLSTFWPGPLTVVVPRNPRISKIAAANCDSIGVRIPNHPVTLELLGKLEFPVAAPSANRSNYISPTKSTHVIAEYGENAPYIIEGGECTTGIESTVLSILDLNNPIILRPGAITKEQIEDCLKTEVGTGIVSVREASNNVNDISSTTMISPGQLSLHYSPKTPLALLSSTDTNRHLPPRIGLIAFSNDLASDFDFTVIKVLSANRNLKEVAVGLYDSLRELDKSNLDLILIDECEPIGLGWAIMDRISRAVSN